MIYTNGFAIAAGVRLIKNVIIPVRDGTRLAADIYLPDVIEPDQKFPLVLEYIPYRKDEANYAWCDFYLVLPRRGYAVVRVDIRGTGASEGISTDEYLPQEQLDGYDVIEWLAQQPWCDGHISMLGISYGGFTALQVAALNPPHLTSIIPVDFTDDRYSDECHYRGGLIRKYYNIATYGSEMVAMNALPPYREWSGEDWARIWQQHLDHNEPCLLKWYRHQTDGDYWRHGSVRYTPEQIQCPVFMIGGWRDGYPNPPLRLYAALQVPRKVLIGPWNHAMPDVAIPGPRIDYLREVVRWLDHWCKGKDTGIMEEPPIVVYMQHYQPPDVDRLDTVGEWRAEAGWPPSGAREMELYLDDDNRLVNQAPAADGVDVFEYDPTVGLTGGLWSGGLQFGLPGDQRPDEALSLVYTTAPVTETIHILGWPHVELHVASSAPVIAFVASLSDVAPDGVSHLVAKGMLNVTRRGSMSDPKPLRPGEIYQLEFQIDCTGWVFSKGHRIRLSIASADWPNVWPTPLPATNSVYRGAGNPSRLSLPVVPVQGSATPPEFATSDKVVGKHSAAISPPTWRFCRDLLTGRATVKIADRSIRRINNTTVFEYDQNSTFQVAPDAPEGASAGGRHIYRIVRPNHQIESQSDVSVQATATHFHLTISLEVRLNGTVKLTRSWTESIAREYL